MIKTGLNESIADRLTDTSLRYLIHLPAENLSLSSFFNSFTRGPLCESMESFAMKELMNFKFSVFEKKIDSIPSSQKCIKSLVIINQAVAKTI